MKKVDGYENVAIPFKSGLSFLRSTARTTAKPAAAVAIPFKSGLSFLHLPNALIASAYNSVAIPFKSGLSFLLNLRLDVNLLVYAMSQSLLNQGYHFYALNDKGDWVEAIESQSLLNQGYHFYTGDGGSVSKLEAIVAIPFKSGLSFLQGIP